MKSLIVDTQVADIIHGLMEMSVVDWTMTDGSKTNASDMQLRYVTGSVRCYACTDGVKLKKSQSTLHLTWRGQDIIMEMVIYNVPNKDYNDAANCIAMFNDFTMLNVQCNIYRFALQETLSFILFQICVFI